MKLTAELKDAIKAHALEVYPHECCGYVISAEGKPQAFRCVNSDPAPEENFRIEPEQTMLAERAGEIVALYHSHPNAGAEPTFTDKAMAEALQMPSFVYATPADVWGEYMPEGWKPPLRGRVFAYGLHDCYSLVRDYYQEYLSITLNDYPRDNFGWWNEGKNLYVENFEREGFVRVSDLKLHDVFLMTIKAPVPNHVAIYLGNGNILHHFIGRLSCIEPLDGYWAKHVTMTVRHKSQL